MKTTILNFEHIELLIVLTSLKLSKTLFEAGCKLKSRYSWDGKRKNLHDVKSIIGDKESLKLMKIYPAYDILNDICVKYSKEFFGEDYNTVRTPTHHVLSLCQQNEKQDKQLEQEIEDYIWEHTIFNPKNIPESIGKDTINQKNQMTTPRDYLRLS